MFASTLPIFRYASLLAATLTIGLSDAALAQQTPTSHGVTSLEEVVVTAQKREEKLLDVPMSISALTGDSLTRQGATTIEDIASVVPGLSTLEYAPGQSRTQLRGISSSSGSPTVGLYLDEMPINVDSVQQGADIRFTDLERIEVLRGPQGTLYGEGSMGGTIRYITRNPDLKNASFGFDSAFGNVTDGSNLYRGNIVVNAPIIEDTFAIRLVGGYEKTPGWIRYPLIGATDVNEGKSKTARLKALWKVSENFKATAMLVYQDSDYDSQNFADANRSAPYIALQPSLDTNKLANILLEYDAGSFSVLSSTSYMKRDFKGVFDVTGFFLPVYTTPPPFGLGLPPGAVQSVILEGVTNYKSVSEELRLASKGSGPLSWTTGIFYRDYKEQSDATSLTVPNPLPFELVTSNLNRTSKQFAVFGEARFAFTDRFDSTLGLRYFRDKREKEGASSSFGFSVTEPVGSDTFTSVDPRFVVSYHPSGDSLVYASIAKGFRSGGFNLIGTRPPGCTLPENYDPEDLWTYEVGSNVSLSSGRVILQGSVYRNQWKNIQVLQTCPGSTTSQVSNVGRASGTGLDLQLTLRPIDALTLALSAGYNDSQYDDDSASHIKGDRIDFVPKVSFGTSGDYGFQWTQSLPGRLHVDYQYVDKFAITLRNFPGPNPVSNSDSYGRLNARLSVLSGKWEFAVFGQNLTDTNKVVMPPTGVLLVPVSMQPRTVGLGVRYNY